MENLNDRTLVTFVHNYTDENIQLKNEKVPALWEIKNGKSRFYNYQFPRIPDDFKDVEEYILGDMPKPTIPNFKRLPRFGFTGIRDVGNYVYAGSWNSVYKIRKENLDLENIITNNLMNDMHGIYVDKDIIITVLTGKDTIVFTDHEGNVIDHFTIKNDLSVVKEDNIEKYDWRFISKQFRGSTGCWHFNFIQKFGDELWLTARNINSFVVVNLKTHKAHLRLMNFFTPALVHDGKKSNNRFYFTSIDGKIIIAEEAEKATFKAREKIEKIHLFDRDLITKTIRLEETELAREPNWCRGIDIKDDRLYVTIDGRYDTDLSFGLLVLNEEGKVFENHRLNWSDIGDESKIKFVTGFDVLNI